MIRIFERDSAATIEVDRGEVMTISLKENPTTGYRWSYEPLPGIQPIGDDYKAVRSEGSEEAVGVAGLRELQFIPTQPGTFTLQLKNWREWEGESSVIDRFTVKIIVR
ncbi:protease inhibitor I42 family protein [Proteiniclasticum sp. QWL-01]|uniref:protease inhibitor I42 family protein n=1 Tax=Proteiniclasticum sp. QWL-01 TaxID=3036945 RepID=UPI002204A255|nr:protease inhibitor I42 family protein [Proteiniclasticum sp. QWL-01]UUM12981.1 protease inhibitor I42 family protein [Clostridiaceae bacterium HFYG-1003]WFF71406.1 protease inhibitor I42 family protein [Proteiniclasticum sp. QWL-01]